MLPKEYFEDPLTEGVAFGAFEHVLDNRCSNAQAPRRLRQDDHINAGC